MKVFQQLYDFRGQSSIKTWLLAITRNTARDVLRSAWVRRVVLFDTIRSRAQTSPSAERESMDKLMAEEIWAVVLKLPRKLREVLLLSSNYGLSMSEMADMLRVSAGTVKSRLHRARAAVNRKLGQEAHWAGGGRVDMKQPGYEWERRLAGKPPVKNGFTSELENKVRERIRMTTTTRRRAPLRTAAALLCLAVLLAGGWRFGDDLKQLLQPRPHADVPAALSKDPLAAKEYDLKVQQFEMNNTFEYSFKKPFNIRHPSVKLSIAESPDALYGDPGKFEAWFDAEQPDVVQVPYNVYAKLAADGRLKPLDVLAKTDKSETGTLYAPLIELLRQAGGNGELYGLSYDLTSTALYVNEELFAARGVPLPEGPVTAEELLQLAARFRGAGISGLAAVNRSNPFATVAVAGQTSGLQTIVDQNGRLRAKVDSEGWKRVWTTVVDGYRTGWMNQAKPVQYGKNGTTMADIGKQDPFALGEVAMTLSQSYYYGNLKQYEQSGIMHFNWRTVPIRLDPSATNQEAYLGTSTVYAINAKSAQADAAWELLRFVAGGAWQRNVDPTSYLHQQVLAAPTSMDQAFRKEWEAFYAAANVDSAKAASGLAASGDPRLIQVNQVVYKLGGEAMDAILKDGKSVDDALADFQSRLDARLAVIGKGGQAP
ncbi:Sigma-70, region 4 [Paenibacillus sp. UNC496MF]|nr:Sigma-70, region 4 [Paenibacillus sp. UNC496MF]